MQMKIVVKRVALRDKYVIGKMYIDGEYFCDTLEDTNRDLNKDGDLNDEGEGKVFGETAIPYGTYKVILNMSSKFKRLLPLLIDVPHFKGIRIHRGNDARHTHGCILVGKNTSIGKLTNSTQYEQSLINKMKNKVNITIDIV